MCNGIDKRESVGRHEKKRKRKKKERKKRIEYYHHDDNNNKTTLNFLFFIVALSGKKPFTLSCYHVVRSMLWDMSW